jgi:hypothetical protein
MKMRRIEPLDHRVELSANLLDPWKDQRSTRQQRERKSLKELAIAAVLALVLAGVPTVLKSDAENDAPLAKHEASKSQKELKTLRSITKQSEGSVDVGAIAAGYRVHNERVLASLGTALAEVAVDGRLESVKTEMQQGNLVVQGVLWVPDVNAAYAYAVRITKSLKGSQVFLTNVERRAVNGRVLVYANFQIVSPGEASAMAAKSNLPPLPVALLMLGGLLAFLQGSGWITARTEERVARQQTAKAQAEIAKIRELTESGNSRVKPVSTDLAVLSLSREISFFAKTHDLALQRVAGAPTDVVRTQGMAGLPKTVTVEFQLTGNGSNLYRALDDLRKKASGMKFETIDLQKASSEMGPNAVTLRVKVQALSVIG